jgi:hypothetical protein
LNYMCFIRDPRNYYDHSNTEKNEYGHDFDAARIFESV